MLTLLEVVGGHPHARRAPRGEETPHVVYLLLQQECRARLSLVARGTESVSGNTRPTCDRRCRRSIRTLPIFGERTLADQAGPVALSLTICITFGTAWAWCPVERGDVIAIVLRAMSPVAVG